MRQLTIAAVLCVLAAATSAQAQVTGVVTSRTVNLQDELNGLYVSSSVADSAMQYSFPNGSYAQFQAIENYQVSADVTPSAIDFANNATTQGFDSLTSTTTSVAVTYTNGGSAPVSPILQSTILPGGFGFYMDDPGSNPTLVGDSVGNVNQTPQSTEANFTNISGYAAAGPGGSVAYAGFNFEILSGSTVLKSYSGDVALYLSPGDPYGETYAVVPSAAPALNGFALVTPAGSDVAAGYQWGATNVDVPLGVTLAPNQSSTLTYVSTVTTLSYIQNFNDCSAENVCSQLLAYSGFGDPIGKSGGAGGDDPYFPLFQLSLPTFDPSTGILDGPTVQALLPSLPLPGVTPAPFIPIPPSLLDAVPEPETWSLMLTGLAFVGAMLRSRQAAVSSPRAKLKV